MADFKMLTNRELIFINGVIRKSFKSFKMTHCQK
jgi:hypothetical protein